MISKVSFIISVSNFFIITPFFSKKIPKPLFLSGGKSISVQTYLVDTTKYYYNGVMSFWGITTLIKELLNKCRLILVLPYMAFELFLRKLTNGKLFTINGFQNYLIYTFT